MVSQVPVVGILMIVNGSLACLGGLVYVVLGPFMFTMGINAPQQNAGNEKAFLAGISVFYVAIGVLQVVLGVLNIVGGVRALKYRGRTFVLAALFGNLMCMGSYCFLASIGIMVYGLIVMFNHEVVKAFEMGERGASPEEIKDRFSHDYRDDDRDDDYDDDDGRPPPPERRDDPPEEGIKATGAPRS